jgi:cysteine dioxygenase
MAHANLNPKQLLTLPLPPRPAPRLAPAEMREFMRQFKDEAVCWARLGPHVAYSPRGYVRKRLFRNGQWEMLLLCWLPGQKTVIHDHGGSWGATRVLSGSLHESLFRWRESAAALSRQGGRTVKTAQITVESDATIHQVENRGAVPAISLHVYSPPLVRFHSYHPQLGTRHTVKPQTRPMMAVGGVPQPDPLYAD